MSAGNIFASFGMTPTVLAYFTCGARPCTASEARKKNGATTAPGLWAALSRRQAASRKKGSRGALWSAGLTMPVSKEPNEDEKITGNGRHKSSAGSAVPVFRTALHNWAKNLHCLPPSLLIPSANTTLVCLSDNKGTRQKF